MQQANFQRGPFLGGASNFRPLGRELGCLPCMMRQMKQESEEEFRRRYGVVGAPAQSPRLDDPGRRAR